MNSTFPTTKKLFKGEFWVGNFGWLKKFYFGLIRFVCVMLLTTAKLNNNNTEFDVGDDSDNDSTEADTDSDKDDLKEA